MGNASGSFMTASISDSVTNAVTSIQTKITKTCNKGNATVNNLDGVKVTITSSVCPVNSSTTVNVGNQDATYVGTCVDSTTLDTVASSILKNFSNSVNDGGANASLDAFGFTDDVRESNSLTDVKNVFASYCSTNNVHVNNAANVKLDINPSGCQSLNALNQTSTITAQCYLKLYDATLSKTAETSAGSDTKGLFASMSTVGAIVMGIVLLVLLAAGGFGVYWYVKHHKKEAAVTPAVTPATPLAVTPATPPTVPPAVSS